MSDSSNHPDRPQPPQPPQPPPEHAREDTLDSGPPSPTDPVQGTPPSQSGTERDRRSFLATTIAVGMPVVVGGTRVLPWARRMRVREGWDGDAIGGGAAGPAIGPEAVPVELLINGRTHRLQIEPRVTLLDALREYAGLTGTKKGCDQGQCGACTVHVAGRRVLSCLTLAMQAHGKAVTTIEGLAQGSVLHPMQEAFIEHDAFQCGYCTPGQIMSAVALLGEPCGQDDADVRECLSGNICRCGAYPNIVAAVQDVRAKRPGSRGTASGSGGAQRMG